MTDDHDVSVGTLKRWLSNVESAQRMWATIPVANVNLGTWRKSEPAAPGPEQGAPGCGTIACLGGWCAWWPEFMAQGVAATRGGSPHFPADKRSTHADVAEELFGARYMFDTRSPEEYEESDFQGADGKPIDDYDVVSYRLQTRYMALCTRLDC